MKAESAAASAAAAAAAVRTPPQQRLEVLRVCSVEQILTLQGASVLLALAPILHQMQAPAHMHARVQRFRAEASARARAPYRAPFCIASGGSLLPHRPHRPPDKRSLGHRQRRAHTPGRKSRRRVNGLCALGQSMFRLRIATRCASNSTSTEPSTRVMTRVYGGVAVLRTLHAIGSTRILPTTQLL